MLDLISHKDVLTRLGISRPTLWRMRSRGEFIAQVRISERKLAFRASDFSAWLESRTIH